MKEFGSGHFGEWITDEMGLPAFNYTCNQLTDPAAASPTNELWRKSNDQSFQFGNNRITCVASNFGTVQVRQDEGAPKFLGDIDPKHKSFGGGIGWLKDGESIISTYYNGQEHFRRVFGAGYMRKTADKGDLTVSQLIFAPYGDDPVLVSRVTIENRGEEKKELKWHEYWGTRPYPMSFRTLLLSLGRAGAELETYINNDAQEMRRKFADRYEHRYAAEGGALRDKIRFRGWGLKNKLVWRVVKKKLRPLAETLHNYSYYVGEPDDYEDVNPPEIFLCAADAPVETFITDANAFFGEGGVASPDGLRFGQKGKGKPNNSAMIAVSPVSLPPKGRVTLTYIHGYVPEGFSFDGLRKKYSGDFDKLFAESCECWKNDRISLRVEGQDWIDRELLWHNQSLRGALTYDSAIGEHILSQGHVYQYIMGFQGASRDPLQHVLPFIYSDPGLVCEIIRYTLKTVLPDGTVPYGMCGHGAIMVTPFLSGDLELWLIWTLCEYILASKDLSILEERVRPYPHKGVPQEADTVLNLTQRVFKHFLSATGTGANGLPRMLGGDWNDNVVVGNTDPKEQERIYREGESVLVGAMAASVLELYAEVLKMAGQDGSEALDFAEKQREAVSRQWNGRWFRRAFMGGEIGWVDEDRLWLEPQPWALLSGAASGERAKTLISEIKAKCQDPSPIGAMLVDECPKRTLKTVEGVATNGGIWPSITGTLILALGKSDTAAAYEEWRKNTLAYHTESYPDIWEGTWSGPDTYNSVLSANPGRTHFTIDPEERKKVLSWIDWPVYNLHPHAWTLYCAASLFVTRFTESGVVLSLAFPEAQYSFCSPLISLKRTESGFEGHYCPKSSGNWDIELLFFKEEDFELIVNGNPREFAPTEKGIRFTGEGGGSKPLTWEIKLGGK